MKQKVAPILMSLNRGHLFWTKVIKLPQAQFKQSVLF